MPRQYKCQLYYAYHYSQISYGIEAYGTAAKSNLIKVHRLRNKILKALYNKDWLMPTNDLHKELRILKVVDVHKLFTLRLIYQHQTSKLRITFKEYFKVRNKIHNRDTRNNKKLNILKAKTNYGYNSIKVIGSKIYNQVPEDLKNVETEKKLKQLVKIYLLSKY